MTAGDRLLPLSGPWLSLTMSRMANSASASASASSASKDSRTLAIETLEPSASVPVSRSTGTRSTALSIRCYDSEAKSPVSSAAPINSVGAVTGCGCASSGATLESEAT